LREQVRKKMSAEYREEIDAHFEHMPDRYFQTCTAPEIVDHIRLFRNFLEVRDREDLSPLAPAVKWVAHPNRGHSEFLFCGWDRNALLARIAGSLSVAQLNILSADVFTRTDNLVLDIFRVCNTSFEAVTDPSETALVEKRLRQSMEEENFDFAPLLEKSRKKRGFHLSQELDFPTRIVIDNDAHPVYTLVDIQTPDRLGLLYRLLRAFAEVNVQIALSRIATEKGAAIDAFYVTDAEGRKLRNATTIARLQKALQEASQMGAVA
jgi:[protein-PII] uridylyltransferase